MPAPHSPWTTERLDDSFATLREDIRDLSTNISRLQPALGDVRELQQRADTIERDLGRVEVDVKTYITRSVTKQLVIVSTPMFFGAVGIIFALLKGGLA